MTLWVLMDLDTRKMIVPGKSGIMVVGTVRGNELPAPAGLIPKPLGTQSLRTVAFTDLDRNGHMNNTRCMDWIADLLPSRFHERHSVTDFTVCYLAEAREQQELRLSWNLADGCTLQVDASTGEGRTPTGCSLPSSSLRITAFCKLKKFPTAFGRLWGIFTPEGKTLAGQLFFTEQGCGKPVENVDNSVDKVNNHPQPPAYVNPGPLWRRPPAGGRSRPSWGWWSVFGPGPSERRECRCSGGSSGRIFHSRCRRWASCPRA